MKVRGSAVVRALASHHCGPGSNPGVDAICGLSLLLVLSFAPRGFSPGTMVFPSPQKPTFPNSNSIRNRVDEEPLCGSATSKSLYYHYYYILQKTSMVPADVMRSADPFELQQKVEVSITLVSKTRVKNAVRMRAFPASGVNLPVSAPIEIIRDTKTN